jgi:cytochrome oxidase Cu insertion factor (SCO1/SenC/PrrC family)
MGDKLGGRGAGWRRFVPRQMAFLAAGVLLLAAGMLLFLGIDGKVALRVGDKAPDFTLPDQNGQPLHLADVLAHKNVVLAFYIRASTPG